MLRLLVVGVLLIGVSSCVTTGLYTPLGPAWVAVYEDSGGVGTPTKQQKRGEACAYNVMGIVAAGDASLRAAKARAGIKVVSHFDKNILNIFWVFGKSCTIAYGQ